MISILKSPSKYSPANNPLFLVLKSDNPSITYFSVRVLDANDNSLISATKAFVTPDAPDTSGIDLSSILSNYVSTDLNVSSTFIRSFSSNQDYSINVTEMISTSGNTIVASGTTLITGSTVYNAELTDYEFDGYDYNQYYVHSGAMVKFLSDKPSLNNVNSTGKEFLYFLADSGSTVAKAVIKIGASVYSQSFNAGNKKIHRLNISQKDLTTSLGIDFTGVSSFDVYLENASGVKLTEVKTYNIKKLECRSVPVNVIWLNRFGGTSSFQFLNPQENRTIKRNVIKTNKYQNYSIVSNNIYNGSESTYNLSSTSEYSVTTPLLNNDEYQLLSDMLESEQVYIELSNGKLMPVKLNTTSIQVKKRQYSTTSMRFDLKFEAEKGLKFY